uniref:BHLH domain-containing protein n=1 Tax=Macrostomum lignano TaxID=282301 RepID=A0A1I8FNS4_9PLAT
DCSAQAYKQPVEPPNPHSLCDSRRSRVAERNSHRRKGPPEMRHRALRIFPAKSGIRGWSRSLLALERHRAIDAGLRSAAGHLTGWREISDPVEASKALPPDGDEAEVGRGLTGCEDSKALLCGSFRISRIDAKREKSRDAARHRRGRENLEFLAVARLLPLHPEIARQLDKASVIRLAVSYLKLRQLSSTGLPSWCRKPDEEEKKLKQPEAPDLGGLILQAVDGFLMILGTDLTILYISETVSIFLGQSQVDMTGNDLVGYVHTADHAGLIDHTEKLMGRARDEHVALSMENICVRLRSNLGKRNAQVPISGYRTVQLHCQRRVDAGSGQPLGLVALATALPSLALSELYLPANSCVLRLDEKLLHRSRRYQDMNVSVPSSLYQYIFPQHLEAVRSRIKDGNSCAVNFPNELFFSQACFVVYSLWKLKQLH